MKLAGKTTGFSLIEILVVLVIIAILAVVLLPTYSHYVLVSKRQDAIKSILHLQVAEEDYRTTNTTYGTLAQLGESSTSTDGYYTMAVSNPTASSYTLTATATGDQTADSDCLTFTLTYANGTTTKSSSPTTTCWTS